MIRPAKFHIFDYILGPILRIIWEPFSIKRSHFWHWQRYDNEINSATTVLPDVTASPRYNLWLKLWQTNFGWEKVVILQPESYDGNYQIGFTSVEGEEGKTELCSLILKGKIAVLVGPYELSFFAISFPPKKALILQNVLTTTKDKLDKEIILV